MKLFFKIFTRVHVVLFRLTQGVIGSKMRGMPVLLLTTKGRKTGRSWTTPVMYLKDGNGYIISASNNGMDRHPAWYLNLTATPSVELEVNGQRIKAESATLSGLERGKQWDELVRQAPFFNGYQEARTKEIPLVKLSPVR